MPRIVITRGDTRSKGGRGGRGGRAAAEEEDMLVDVSVTEEQVGEAEAEAEGVVEDEEEKEEGDIGLFGACACIVYSVYPFTLSVQRSKSR